MKQRLFQLALFLILVMVPRPLRAQSSGISFPLAFSIKNTTAATVIPPCLGGQTPTTAAPCIQNYGQAGHTITYSWTSGGTLCTMLFDGSNGANGGGPWETLAAANSGLANVTLNQSLGSGNGVKVSFSGTLTQLPLPNTVTVTAGGVTGTDDGAGHITGAGIASGTVTYSTGAIAVTFSAAPGNGVNVNVAYQNSVTTGMIYANGYYTYLRVKLSACAGGSLSAVYTGYSTPLPVTVIADAIVTSSNVAAPLKVTNYGTPYVVKGWQCFNPNNTPAYVQFFKATTAPTLGTGFFFQIGVPAASGLAGTGGTTFVYASPDLPVQNVCCSVGAQELWVGAATTPGGNTAVGTPLVCDFETNGSGPFYPQTPFDPN